MPSVVIEPVARLIEAFSRLPGIGPKTAQRLTYHLLRAPDAEARTLASALVAVRDEVVFCAICFNISDAPTCPICRDGSRDGRRLCVVEEPLDVLAIERTGEWRGRYHVLNGAISPMDGIGPEQLRIAELLERAVTAQLDGQPIVRAGVADVGEQVGRQRPGRLRRGPHHQPDQQRRRVHGRRGRIHRRGEIGRVKHARQHPGRVAGQPHTMAEHFKVARVSYVVVAPAPKVFQAGGVARVQALKIHGRRQSSSPSSSRSSGLSAACTSGEMDCFWFSRRG